VQTERREQVDAAGEAGRDDWDQHWVDYAESAAINPAQRYRQELIVRLLRRDESPPRRVLDIGSGTGDLAAAVRSAFPDAQILGIELSKAGVERSRQKVPGATFVERDLIKSEPPPADQRGWATHAVCVEVLEHLDEPELLLAHAIPYLAPGCLLVITVPGGPMSAFDHHIGHRKHYSPAELRRLLEGVGFEVEQATGAGFPFFNLYRLVVILRGRRLVADAATGRTSTPARLVMAAFGHLFRLRLDALPWGWQTVAHARLPRAG
jgi:2-polyprenyl-3-methyl-5-hydroxy-6-metoxy-1,4-benzoquinol methylase